MTDVGFNKIVMEKKKMEINPILQVIKDRRSVRHFENREVPKEALQAVLEAVCWSPSWANTQCWEVVVVKDAQVKGRILEAVPSANPAAKSIAAAPVVLALCARKGESGYYKGLVTTKFGDWFLFDLGIAAQTICLAAHSLGLGAVIVGLYEHAKVDAALGLPENVENVCLIPLGYPAKIPSAPTRKEIDAFVRRERYASV